MIKILLIVPEPNFIENALEIFAKHNLMEAVEKNTKHSYELEERIVQGEQLKNINFDCDVIISRGILAHTLKNNSQEIPVVDIPVPGYDLIKSINQSKTFYGNKQIAVIGSQNMIFGVESLSEIMQIPIKSYILKSHNQNAQLVDLALEGGCEIVIGGRRTCDYAEQIGVNNTFIKTGEESFWQAVTEAKRLAQVSRKEQERSKRYKTILDYAYEGIIATDAKGYITVFNTASRKLLSITDDNVVGSSIETVIRKSSFRQILLSDEEVNSEVVTFHNVQLTVRKVNIKLRGRIIGQVITFHDVSRIQSMEEEIRKKIYARGHIAKYHFNDILYKSEIMKQAVNTARRFSQTESNILLYGETGTGKEIFAQSIHNYSKHSNGPFVAVNCGALPENLLESELFGYAKGAFTGASKEGKPGVFELAHNGTIFLDEISEMPLKLQTRLLRVLQEREITRLGDDKVIPIVVRVIAATNKSLIRLIDDEKFRQDLYYRLEVLKVHIPPLSQRKEDVELIIDDIIQTFQVRENKILDFTPEAKRELQRYHYHGNVRQLQNICERLFVLCDNEVKALDVKALLDNEGDKSIVLESTADTDTDIYSERQELERKYYQGILEKSKYNKGEMAKRLGVSRTTLWRRLKKLGLD